MTLQSCFNLMSQVSKRPSALIIQSKKKIIFIFLINNCEMYVNNPKFGLESSEKGNERT